MLVTLPLQFIIALVLQSFLPALGVTVFFFNRKSAVNRYFALFLVVLYLWGMAGAMYMYFPVTVHHWVAIQMLAGIYIGPVILMFARSVSDEGYVPGWRDWPFWVPAVYITAISLARIFLPGVSAAFASVVHVSDNTLFRQSDVHYLVYALGVFGEATASLAYIGFAVPKQRDPVARKKLLSLFLALVLMTVSLFVFTSLANLLGRRLNPNFSMVIVFGATAWISFALLRNKAWKTEALLEVIRRNETELERRLQEALVNETCAQRTAILALAKLTEYRDNETGRHLERINQYTRFLALALRGHSGGGQYLTEEYIDDLCLSSILHDIGKVGIPDNILMKPGKLNDEEFRLIQNHTLIGGDVLMETEKLNSGRTFLSIGKMVAYHHHEKWDGSGYPHGMRGDDIPLSARIVAIADVYDALMSERPYKRAFTHEQSVAIITEGRGAHFDPLLVDLFLSIEDRFSAVER
jgi:response regulator RpfG family c-di-GMP phosphodiesterase